MVADIGYKLIQLVLVLVDDLLVLVRRCPFPPSAKSVVEVDVAVMAVVNGEIGVASVTGAGGGQVSSDGATTAATYISMVVVVDIESDALLPKTQTTDG